MTKEQLAEIRAREQAATLGPWREESDQVLYGDGTIRGGGSIATGDVCRNAYFDTEDAIFVAHARQDIPALLDEVERLTRERDAALLFLPHKCFTCLHGPNREKCEGYMHDLTFCENWQLCGVRGSKKEASHESDT